MTYTEVKGIYVPILAAAVGAVLSVLLGLGIAAINRVNSNVQEFSTHVAVVDEQLKSVNSTLTAIHESQEALATHIGTLAGTVTENKLMVNEHEKRLDKIEAGKH